MGANPDGYTIEMGHMGTHALAVALYPKLVYKPEADFEPISIVSAFAMVILARKDFPPKDLNEFASFVKANFNKLNVAHAGVGSIFFTTGSDDFWNWLSHSSPWRSAHICTLAQHFSG
jgi:tripartite-type tricarboxylate transporter receptor subunit TctC